MYTRSRRTSTVESTEGAIPAESIVATAEPVEFGQAPREMPRGAMNDASGVVSEVPGNEGEEIPDIVDMPAGRMDAGGIPSFQSFETPPGVTTGQMPLGSMAGPESTRMIAPGDGAALEIGGEWRLTLLPKFLTGGSGR